MEIKGNKNNFKIIKKGTITTVPNFFASACHCGIKESKKPDICIIYSPNNCTCSGVFTTNNFLAAPVIVSREQLEKSSNIKAMVVNSGIANACTGKLGYENAKKTIDIASKHLEVDPNYVVVASTGVIGKQLPMDKIEKGIKECSVKLSKNGGHNAAEAILTTDLVKKEIAVKYNVGKGKEIIIGGIAKGSGMIEPHMATMLSFVAANVKISKELLNKILLDEIATSFNSITIDGCQSTNDMVLVLANSRSNIEIKNEDDSSFYVFKNALSFVLAELAKKIVKDGEGATKFIEIKVLNAKDKKDAQKLALKVANSMLFKAAIFGGDLNWGRINAALGSANCDFDSNKVDIYLEDVQIVEKGMGIDFDSQRTDKLMDKKEINVNATLNVVEKWYSKNGCVAQC